MVSTGGAGIRIGDGNPTLISNSIVFNEARYGAGIVMNYTGGKIMNNIIAYNFGGVNFDGGTGIWILENLDTLPKIITNNTIMYNTAYDGSGGILAWYADNVHLTNNIVYGKPISGHSFHGSSVFVDPVAPPEARLKLVYMARASEEEIAALKAIHPESVSRVGEQKQDSSGCERRH